jgi:hypothetical protein
MSTTLTATKSAPKFNGVDVDALRTTIDAVNDNKLLGATSWRVNSQWVGGTRSDHHVEGVAIGGEFINGRSPSRSMSRRPSVAPTSSPTRRNTC